MGWNPWRIVSNHQFIFPVPILIIHILLNSTVEDHLKKGPGLTGYWKLNTSILDEPQVKIDIERSWHDVLCAMPLHDMAWWELCKSTFKDILVRHSKAQSKQFKARIRQSESDFAHLYDLEVGAIVPGTFNHQIALVKKMNYCHFQGRSWRSRAQYLEYLKKKA